MRLTHLTYVFDIRDITEGLEDLLVWVVKMNTDYPTKPAISIQGLHHLWWRQTLCRNDKLNVNWITHDDNVFDQYVCGLLSPRMKYHLDQLQQRVWQRLVLPLDCYGDATVDRFHRPTPHQLAIYFQL